MFAVSGIMQGTLLVMCIAWKYRQHKLGVDDFGSPLESVPLIEDGRAGGHPVTPRREVDVNVGEETPLLASNRPHGFSRMNQAVVRRVRKFFRGSNTGR